jgi:hypothetical protein
LFSPGVDQLVDPKSSSQIEKSGGRPVFPGRANLQLSVLEKLAFAGQHRFDLRYERFGKYGLMSGGVFRPC